MIGRVENRHAIVSIPFHIPGQLDFSLDFIVDTGFTGELTLPPAAVAAMGLPFIYDETVNLANDTDAIVPVHSATILWQGIERNVCVFATGQRPLLGTALMDGCELVVQFAGSGLVTIETL